MKKLAVVFLIFIALFVCSGCAEVTYGVYIKADGSVEKKYQVVVDPEADFGSGRDADFALELARAQLKSMLDENKEYGEIVINDENEYDISLVYSYRDLNEFYRAMGYTGDDEPEPDTSTTTEDLLFTVSTDEVFSDVSETYMYEQATQIKNLYFDQHLDISGASINLEYGTAYTKSFTSNADETFVKDGTRIFRWTYPYEKLNKAVYSSMFTRRLMTVKQPNIGNWYAVSIVSSIIVSAIIFVAFRRRKNDGREIPLQP
jgi:hypothetical protein